MTLPGDSRAVFDLAVTSFLLVTYACAIAPEPASFPTRTRSRPSLIDPPPPIPGEFATVDEAALAALDHLVEFYPDHTRWEYAGCIYRDPAGAIRATQPVTLKMPHRCEIPNVQPGCEIIGDYHNHPTRHEFSTIDLESRPAVPHYLLTPDRRVLRHTPEDGRTVRVR